MVRSLNTLACFLLGMALTMFVHIGMDVYVFVIFALALPWDKLAGLTGDLVEEHLRRRAEMKDQEQFETVSVSSVRTD